MEKYTLIRSAHFAKNFGEIGSADLSASKTRENKLLNELLLTSVNLGCEQCLPIWRRTEPLLMLLPS
jgi:hypothetical protein